MLAGTVSLMTRGQLRILHSVRAGGFRTATGSVLSDGSALIDACRGPVVRVNANGRVSNAAELDAQVRVACGPSS